MITERGKHRGRGGEGREGEGREARGGREGKGSDRERTYLLGHR